MSEWGGTREGAGRPPKGDARRVTKAWSMDPKVAAWIEHLAAELGVSQSQLVNRTLRGALERDGFDPDREPGA